MHLVLSVWGTVSDELYGSGAGRVILTEQMFTVIQQVMYVAFGRRVPQFRTLFEIVEMSHFPLDS